MKFTIYQESRPGTRANNEDRLAHCYSRDALLTVVADGMGGHYYGEVAAQIAVQTLIESFQRKASPALDDPFLFLQQSMNNAHRAIVDFADTHRLGDSPRTTCVACVVQNNVAYWAHCGDSRLYLIRNGRVIARTRDHSRVRLLLDRGAINEAQAAIHPDKNKIYSCLGGPATPEIEFSRKTPLEAGDLLLLCTDGLWGPLPDEMLAAGLQADGPMQALPVLFHEAEIRGGAHADNLSAIAFRWEDSYDDAQAATSLAISTQSMDRETVSTRLDEFGHNPGYKTELAENEIERAIAEIRAAIHKYSK